MPNRYYWVLMTYLTRPLVWLMLAGAIIFFVFSIVGMLGRTQSKAMYPEPPRPRLLVNTKASLDKVRAAGRQDQVDAIDLERLWGDMGKQMRWDPVQQREAPSLSKPDDNFYEILREFPNVRQVRWGSFGGDVPVEEFARLSHLECLTISMGFGVVNKQGTLARLASLRNLRLLELSVFSPLDHFDSLAAWPSLQTIVFRSTRDVDDQVLEEMARLPHLKTVVIDILDTPQQDLPFSTAGFEALAKSPTLEKLYLGGRSPGDHERLLASAAPAFLGRTIYTARAEQPMQFPFIARIAPAFLLAGAIGFQLASQFRSPGSRLMPGFVTVHAQVAIALALSVVGLVTLGLMVSGGQPLAACLATTTIVSLFIAAMLNNSASSLSPGPRWKPRQVIVMLCLFAFFGVVFLPDFDERVLIHPAPTTLLAMAAASTLFIVVIVATFRQLPLELVTPFNFPFDTRQQLPAFDFTGSKPAVRGMVNLVAGEQRIERLPKISTQRDVWSRAQHWRAANQPLRNIVLALFFLAMSVIMYVGFQFIMQAGIDFLFQQMSIMSLSGLLALALMVGGQWRNRMLVLPIEVLRPVSQHSLRREWALGLVLDLLPVAAIMSLAFAVAQSYLQEQRFSASFVVYFSVLVFIAAYPVSVMMASIFAIIERQWLAFGAALGVFMLLTFAVVPAIFIVPTLGHRAGVKIIPTLFWLPAMIAGAVCYIAWLRWQRQQCDRRA